MFFWKKGKRKKMFFFASLKLINFFFMKFFEWESIFWFSNDTYNERVDKDLYKREKKKKNLEEIPPVGNS